MKLNKARIGFLLGIIVALLIGTADIPGLARNGQICMALSFMTVIFWGFQIAQPGYTSGLYLLLLAVFGVEKPGLIFSDLDRADDVFDRRCIFDRRRR